MARVLIVGCGCRGQALTRELIEAGHAVRGTTRDAERLPAIEAAGAEAVLADPDRLVTMMPAIEGVSVVCWLLGTADVPELHGPRLESMLEHIVDTPVRGFVYEKGAAERPEAVAIVERAASVWQMRTIVLEAPPAEYEMWLGAARVAVDVVLGG